MQDEVTDPQILHAYRALQTAAERIGMNNYRAGLYKPVMRKGKVIRGITITAEHAAVIQASKDVLAGRITPNEAMALLHEHDVEKQRLGI